MINEDYKKLTSFLEKKIKDYEKFFSSYRQKNKIKFNKFPKKINYIEHNIDKLLENSSSMLTVLNTINLDEKFTIKLLAHQSIELSLKALYLLTGNIEKSDKQWKKHEFIIDSNKLSKSSSHFFSLIASIKKHPSIRLLEKNFYLTERYGIEENLELFGLSRFNPSPINDNSLDFKDIIYCTNLIYLIVKNYRLNFLLPTKENSKEYTGDLKSGDFKICKNFLYFKDYCLCKDTFEGSNDNFFCCLSEISDFSKNFIKTLKKSNIISKKKNWDSPVQIILETTTPVLINHIIIHRKFNENRRIQHDINSFNFTADILKQSPIVNKDLLNNINNGYLFSEYDMILTSICVCEDQINTILNSLNTPVSSPHLTVCEYLIKNIFNNLTNVVTFIQSHYNYDITMTASSTKKLFTKTKNDLLKFDKTTPSLSNNEFKKAFFKFVSKDLTAPSYRIYDMQEFYINRTLQQYLGSKNIFFADNTNFDDFLHYIQINFYRI